MSIGGDNSHVRLAELASSAWLGVTGFVVVRASAPGAQGVVGLAGGSNLSFPALDLETSGSISVLQSVVTTARQTRGPVAYGATIGGALRLASFSVSISAGVRLVSAGDLFVGHYSGDNAASPWGAAGVARIGNVSVASPTAFEAGRDLVMLSHLRTSGAGVLQLIADADGDLDGSLQITAQVQVYGASGRRNGTVFMVAHSFKIQPGARVHLDQGDLLVTAVNFAFGPAPLCRTRSELSGELNLPENQAFLVRSNTTPGVAYFEPFPASISSITSSVPVLSLGVGERGKGRARFATAGGDVLTVSGSAFGPWDLEASLSLYVGDAACALLPRDRHMPSIVPQSGAQVSVWGVREYSWLLLNGTLLRRFAYSFSFACALPAGTGASLDVFVLAGGCAGARREQSLLGYAAPQIASILPASVLVKGAGGGGVLLTFLGASFGVSEPSLSAASAASVTAGGDGTCAAAPAATSSEKAGNTDAFAAYLMGVGARDAGVGGGVAVGGGGGGGGGGAGGPSVYPL